MSTCLLSWEAELVRTLLTSGLYRLHRPELREVIEQADFALDEQTLVVKIYTAHDETVDRAITTAALNAGLAVEDARCW